MSEAETAKAGSPRGAGRDRTAARLWTAVLLLSVLLLVLGLSRVWLQVGQVESGYRVAAMHEEYRELLGVHRKLVVEWNRLQDPHYLEKLARENLNLHPPRDCELFAGGRKRGN